MKQKQPKSLKSPSLLPNKQNDQDVAEEVETKFSGRQLANEYIRIKYQMDELINQREIHEERITELDIQRDDLEAELMGLKGIAPDLINLLEKEYTHDQKIKY